MCVNNLPRVALDSGVAGIQTRDLLITSPASQPLGHRATHTINCNNTIIMVIKWEIKKKQLQKNLILEHGKLKKDIQASKPAERCIK